VLLEVLVTQVCTTGQCPQVVQISPTVTVYAVASEIYRPNPLAGLLRKNRQPQTLLILTAPPQKVESGKKE
jgi:hypothetical protein